MRYEKKKRGKVGTCNLCLNNGPLSWDHVPPKGGIELTPVQMERIFDVFAINRDKKALKESQNGVKFRTICSTCNSFLGTNYDPVLNKFAQDIGMFVNSVIGFPEYINIKTKPKLLIKAILAHLVASKKEVDGTVLDRQIRNIIFDIEAPIPDSINIFYWLYHYNTTVIMRDFSMPAKRGHFGNGSGIFNLIKYFPIGYLISDLTEYEGLDNLTKFKNFRSDSEIEIPVNLRRVEHPYWPELVDDGNFLLTSSATQSGISATPRRKISTNRTVTVSRGKPQNER